MQEALKARLMLPSDGGPALTPDETGQLVERVVKQAHSELPGSRYVTLLIITRTPRR